MTHRYTISLFMLFALVSCTSSGSAGVSQDENVAATIGAPLEEDVGVVVGDGTLHLPQPELFRVPPRSLTPSEKERADEVEALLIRRYRGYRIVATTQTYVGDIVDWVDPKTVPGALVPPPPPVKISPSQTTQPAMTELEAYPELRGPEGTMPIIRPTFFRYVKGESTASSLDDFIKHHQALGQPADRYRLYGGYSRQVQHHAAAGTYNAWATGGIEDLTFALEELASECDGTNPSTDREQVGMAMSRDRFNFGDDTLRFQTEFLTAGDQVGNLVGGWAGWVTGFVQVSQTITPGAAITPLSTAGGTQYDAYFEVQLYQGNWWVDLGGTWVGYYPGTLFNLINSAACKAFWYGEVMDGTPTDWTANNMGSGAFASQGFGYAAFIREPFYADTGDISRWFDYGTSPSLALPYATACYTTSAISTNGGTGWDRYFYLGGPGGDQAGCD